MRKLLDDVTSVFTSEVVDTSTREHVKADCSPVQIIHIGERLRKYVFVYKSTSIENFTFLLLDYFRPFQVSLRSNVKLHMRCTKLQFESIQTAKTRT